MNDSKPAHRLRLSLKSMLVAVTMIAIAFAFIQLSSELRPLRTEVQRLRDETGQLTIENRKRIHAIQIATDYPLAWKWRVYIPAGKKVRVAHQNHKIPKDGLPQAKDTYYLSGPLEFVVKVTIDKQPDGKWRTAISRDGITSYRTFPEDAITWLTKGDSGSSLRQVGRSVSVEETGRPMVLLRKRVFYNSGGSIPPTNEPAETDGLLIWLAE